MAVGSDIYVLPGAAASERDGAAERSARSASIASTADDVRVIMLQQELQTTSSPTTASTRPRSRCGTHGMRRRASASRSSRRSPPKRTTTTSVEQASRLSSSYLRRSCTRQLYRAGLSAYARKRRRSWAQIVGGKRFQASSKGSVVPKAPPLWGVRCALRHRPPRTNSCVRPYRSGR
jgi:hypothetical protein